MPNQSETLRTAWQLAVESFLDHTARTGSFDADILRGVQEVVRELRQTMEEYRREVRTIRGSGDYTRQGADAKIAEMSRSYRDRILQFMRSRINNRRGALEQAEKSLQTRREPDGDPTLQYWREREVREILRDMDPMEAVSVYLAAASSGKDPLLEAAIESAPRIRPLVSDEILEKAREARAERLAPEVAARIRDLGVAISTLESARSGAIAELGLPDDDPILVLAAGGAGAEN